MDDPEAIAKFFRHTSPDAVAFIQAEALREAVVALRNEDEIAHGEAVKDGPDGYVRLGLCAYDDDVWPCRTQRGIDRLLAKLGEGGNPGD